MDRFESMSVLLAVVEAGSFSGAGRRLRQPVPTVSRKVAELEARLKARLLTRSTRRIALTEAGQSYVTACRRILEDVLEAERAAAGEYRAPRGELVLTAPIVFGRLHVLPVLAAFLAAYPEVTVRMELADRPLDLIDEHLDLAVRIGEPPERRLIAIPVGEVRSVVCGSPAHFAQHGVPAHPDELARHPCIAFAGLSGAHSWVFSVDGAAHPVRIHPRLIVNTAEAALDAAVAGVGLTRVLSYQAAEAVKAGGLRPVLQRFEPQPLPVSLLYRGAPPLALKLRAFLDFAAPRLRERLAADPP